MSVHSFHFHIGIHDVYPSLLAGVCGKVLSEEVKAASVSLLDDWTLKSILRPAIRGEAGAEVVPVSTLRAGPEVKRTVISAHGILSENRQILSNMGVYAESGIALDVIARIFMLEDLTLHLVVQPQHDCALIADTIRQPGQDISWVTLVDEIKDKMPTAKLVVWPIEDQIADSVEFVSGVTGLSLSPRTHAAIRNIARNRMAKKASRLHDHMDDLSTYLDDVYLSDMREIAAMPDVEIGLERARNEFSVS